MRRGRPAPWSTMRGTGELVEEQFDAAPGGAGGGIFGGGNAGRPLLLDGGLKWQAMSLTPADMDFVGLKAAAAREIALAFGVPPLLLGLPGDATYANYREANRALWRLTVLPMAERILRGLSAGWRRGGRGQASGRRRPDQRSGRGPRAAVAAGERGGFPQRRREAGDAGLWGGGRDERPG